MTGKFVISLDFELHWGVFDVRSVESYKNNLLKVKPVITRMMELADKYGISLTFSTVGFLFAETKKELSEYLPLNKPTYANKNLSPYPLLNTIGNTENEDPFHFANSIIIDLVNNGKHEIGSHTFSHYYCHEPGQTIDQFEDDLKASISIAKSKNLKLESIVFPRNMIDPNLESDQKYLDVCYNNGLKSFRGKEKSFIYNDHNLKLKNKFALVVGIMIYAIRFLRLLDSYINITGYNTYNLKNLKGNSKVLNLPSSRFLRSYSQKLRILEGLKLRRIKKAMKYAAKNNELYHLWWHPHNFGSHTDKNFASLEEIFITYSKLNKKYNFQSMTMTELTNQLSTSN